jgi:hypothetical protein
VGSPRAAHADGKPEKTSAREFTPVAEELLDRIMQMGDNAGATDEDRAKNYCMLRHKGIYRNLAEAFQRNESLAAIQVLHSPLSGTSKVMDVVLKYVHRVNGVTEAWSVSVDVGTYNRRYADMLRLIHDEAVLMRIEHIPKRARPLWMM